MKKWVIEIFKKEEFLQIISLIFKIWLLNSFTSLIQQLNNQLLAVKEIQGEKIQRHVFSSFNSIIFVKKLSVFLLSLFLVKTKNLLNKKNLLNIKKFSAHQYENETHRLSELKSIGDTSPRSEEYQDFQATPQINYNDVFQISSNTQIILGFLSFVAILIFAQLQKLMNVYFIIQFKYLSLILIIVFIHLVINRTTQSRDGNHRLYLLFRIALYTVPIIIFSMLVKLNLTGLPGFYMANLGNSHQNLALPQLLKSISLFCIDAAFYTILFVEKEKYYKKPSLQQSGQIKSISSEQILFSTSKYLLVLLFLLIIWTGELSFLLRFIISHPSSILILLKLSCFYFLQQYIIYDFLIKYDAHIFFSILSTNGLYGKIYDYIFRFWNINSLMAISLILALVQQIKDAVKFNKNEGSLFNRKDRYKEFFSNFLCLIIKNLPFKYLEGSKKITI